MTKDVRSARRRTKYTARLKLGPPVRAFTRAPRAHCVPLALLLAQARRCVPLKIPRLEAQRTAWQRQLQWGCSLASSPTHAHRPASRRRLLPLAVHRKSVRGPSHAAPPRGTGARSRVLRGRSCSPSEAPTSRAPRPIGSSRPTVPWPHRRDG